MAMGIFRTLAVVFFSLIFSAGAAHATQSAALGVWVSKLDGSISCDTEKGEKTLSKLEAGKKELRKAGVKVLQSKMTTDGLMRPAVCGIPTGNENTYLIPESQLKKAEGLGYALKSKASESYPQK